MVVGSAVYRNGMTGSWIPDRGMTMGDGMTDRWISFTKQKQSFKK